MNRIKRYTLTIAAIFGAQLSAVAESNSSPEKADSNTILDRVAKIQQEAESQGESPKLLDNPQIAQWYNWSDWSDWQNWQNWYN